MTSERCQEELARAPERLRPARPYRNFFEWKANYPFDPGAVREAVARTEPRTTDLVGCANITNILSFIMAGEGGDWRRLRVFDHAQEPAALISYYFEQVVTAATRDPGGSATWHLPSGTELPVVGGPHRIVAPMDCLISFHPVRYEQAFRSSGPPPDLVLVDKTLMWSDDPCATLAVLADQRGRLGHRVLLLSIYHRQPLIVHSFRGSRRLGGLRTLDRASYPGNAYPGFLGTLGDILSKGAEPIVSFAHRPRLYGYPRRTGRITHWLPECDVSEVDLDRPVYARQYGEPVLSEEAKTALLAGERTLWADRELLLHRRRTGPHDRLFLIGAFDIVDALLTPSMLDLERATRTLARRHYSAAAPS